MIENGMVTDRSRRATDDRRLGIVLRCDGGAMFNTLVNL